jgi:hypothetical protein
MPVFIKKHQQKHYSTGVLQVIRGENRKTKSHGMYNQNNQLQSDHIADETKKMK